MRGGVERGVRLLWGGGGVTIREGEIGEEEGAVATCYQHQLNVHTRFSGNIGQFDGW